MINTRFDDWYTILLISFSLARSKLLVLTHTHEHSLIPFHIFFSLRYYFVVHDSGLVPAKLPALLRSLLSLYFCLFKTKKNRLYYRVFLPPVSFFAKDVPFLCVKFFFIKRNNSEMPIYWDISLSFWKKKGWKNCNFVGYQNFPFFFSRVFITYLAICRTDMLIFHVTFSLSPFDFWPSHSR